MWPDRRLGSSYSGSTDPRYPETPASGPKPEFRKNVIGLKCSSPTLSLAYTFRYWRPAEELLQLESGIAQRGLPRGAIFRSYRVRRLESRSRGDVPRIPVSSRRFGFRWSGCRGIARVQAGMAGSLVRQRGRALRGECSGIRSALPSWHREPGGRRNCVSCGYGRRFALQLVCDASRAAADPWRVRVFRGRSPQHPQGCAQTRAGSLRNITAPAFDQFRPDQNSPSKMGDLYAQSRWWYLRKADAPSRDM